MSKFWDLFRESIILQSLITLVLIAALVYLYIRDGVVPEQLLQMTWVIVGFWFGTKVQSVQTQAVLNTYRPQEEID